jgi:adenylate cyclase
MVRIPAWFAKELGTGSRSRFPTFIALAIAVGTISAILVLVPQVRSVEQNLGLGWLFRLRGPVAAPREVVLVTISRAAAANIFLPRDAEKFHRCDDVRIGAMPATHVSLPSLPARWPRCLHAMLVDKLSRAGARTVALDVLFRTRPPLPGPSGDLNAEQDRQLAAAMARARRVLIAGKLESSQISPSGIAENSIEISPHIVDVALGNAPFPLLDHGRRFDEFMVFTEGGSATPSLPALAMQAYSLDVYPQFREMLAKMAPDQAQLLPATVDEIRGLGQLQATCLLIRQIFSAIPGLAARMQTALAGPGLAGLNAEVRTRIGRLVELYSGPRVRLLNVFGPPGTIRAYGYDQALAFSEEQSTTAFRDKMVFVGYAEFHSPEQAEHFPTVFSSGDGVALSGVEIAATAFANLLRGDTITQTSRTAWTLIALLAGLICTALCLWLPNRIAFPTVAALVFGYGVIAFLLFATRSLWLPVVIPMFVAAPLGLGAGTLWTYEMARRQRNQIRKAFSQFVPKEVVAMLERNAEHIGRTRESVECACVATDAANFTTLAESMSPEQLADFLNVYYEALFRSIPRHGGFVSDVVGDAMLAIWPNRTPETRRHVCAALLEMREAAGQFNQRLAANRLATRFGVDWGRVVLTTVGAHEHYEYRAVGDPVNTANRVQELNKKLGTRVLVSEPALEGVEEFLLRDVGYFLLRGKVHPVHAFELIGPKESAGPKDLELCERFARALALLHNRASAEALSAFRNLAADFPDDGPAAFYQRVLESGTLLRDGALKVD